MNIEKNPYLDFVQDPILSVLDTLIRLKRITEEKIKILEQTGIDKFHLDHAKQNLTFINEGIRKREEWLYNLNQQDSLHIEKPLR